jgi:biopolymer transport protein TolR
MARHRAQRQKRPLMAEINVVPYIDVMLVLLVIFMVTAPLLKTGVEVDLPNTDAKAVEPGASAEPIILTITSAGAWYVNVGEQPESPIDKDTARQLVARILSAEPGRSVLVNADENVVYRQVMEGMVALQRAGARKVQLMSDPPL